MIAQNQNHNHHGTTLPQKLAGQGFSVFPCRRGEKIPATEHGCLDATNDPSTIVHMFTEEANVGIATGKGLFVLDFDATDGLQRFQERYQPLPKTVTAQTPRGGHHCYFRSEAEIRNSQGKIFQATDIRGTGGYVVAPPSKVNGKPYIWLPGHSPDDIPVAAAPDWLVALIAAVGKGVPAQTATTSSVESQAVRACRAKLESLPAAVAGQGGHNATYRAACVIKRSGVSFAEGFQLLREYNARCTPPWDEKEIYHKLEDAYTKVDVSPAPNVDAGKLAEEVRLTDVGNAKYFARRNRGQILYVPGIGWHVWSGGRWQADDAGAIVQTAEETIFDLQAEAAATRNRELARHAAASLTAGRMAAMIETARSEPGLFARAKDLDADNFLLNLKNGTLCLRTFELEPHRPENKITKIAPVKYDPLATCPRFDRFMREVFSVDEKTVEYVLKILGMCLTGDITSQLLPIFYGEGANGKSTLISIVLHIMGDYAATASDTLLIQNKGGSHPTELADLQGRRLVVASETESGARIRTQLLKRLTGDSTIKARRMRQDFYEFPRTHKMIIQTNNKPVVRENTNAIWRRLKLVPFERTFSKNEQDTGLLDELVAEASGILNRLVEGCRLWTRDGLDEPEKVVAATSTYREDSDPISLFLEEKCNVVAGGWASTRDLVAAFNEFSKDTGGHPVNPRIFGELLSRHAAASGLDVRPKLRYGGGRGWSGITLIACTYTAPD